MKTSIVDMLKDISFQEVLASRDVDFLDKCRRIYEYTEEYEKCAKIRDRIKKINDANANRLLK